jgi:hypothetical protein
MGGSGLFASPKQASVQAVHAWAHSQHSAMQRIGASLVRGVGLVFAAKPQPARPQQ